MTYITDYPAIAECCRHMTDSGGDRFRDDGHLENTIQRVLDNGINGITDATLGRCDRRLALLSPDDLVEAASPDDYSHYDEVLGKEGQAVLETIYDQA